MGLTLPYDYFWWKHMVEEGERNPNEYILLDFDPGAAAMGWAMFGVHVGAFAESRAYIQEHLLWWDCGELTGTENEILNGAIRLIDWVVARAIRNNRPIPPVPALHILSEAFDLTQTIGDNENLLSPVRQNAVLAWECHKRGVELRYQGRNLRTAITAERLNLYGFEGRWRTTGKGKDKFAAMQHGVTHLKKIKRESIGSPWRVCRPK